MGETRWDWGASDAGSLESKESSDEQAGDEADDEDVDEDVGDGRRVFFNSVVLSPSDDIEEVGLLTSPPFDVHSLRSKKLG